VGYNDTQNYAYCKSHFYATALHMAPRGVAEASLTYLTAHLVRGINEGAARPLSRGSRENCASWVISRPLLRAYCARDGEGLRAQQGHNKAAFIERTRAAP
jgi:hypothetical protein